jgi:hypothetical protein
MRTINERALARRAAIRAELGARYPALIPAQRPLVERFDRSAIVLGRDRHGNVVSLPLRPRLEHMHVIGTTGGGKSKHLERDIQQDIAHGYGVFVADPHGEHPDSLYRSLLAWLDASGYAKKRTVHLIDPNASSHTVGFNPLKRPDAETDLSVLAGVTLEAFSRAWGGEDMSSKPTIERVLMAIFTALADLGLTLAEAPYLLDRADGHGLRAHAIRELSDRYARDELARLHELSLDEKRRRDFDAEVVGPLNRIARFVRPSAIRAMVGQTNRVLDFQKAFDEGHIILCNLSGGKRIYERDADLLGRLLTRSLFFHAKRRQRPEVPFFVYLDECHRYLSGDLENILAESRKYGVAAVLSHQWLQQFAAEGDNMLAAVRNATNVKVVFRIKDPVEAEDLAHTVVPLDLEIPVRSLIRPTVVGHRRVRLDSESESAQTANTTSVSKTTGESESRTESYATMEAATHADSNSSGSQHSLTTNSGTSQMHSTVLGMNAMIGQTLSPNNGMFFAPDVIDFSQSFGSSAADVIGFGSNSGTARSDGVNSSHGSSDAATVAITRGESISYGTNRSRSVGAAQTHAAGKTRGTAESLEPILEDRPSSVHSKESVLYFAAQTLRNLPTGTAFINYVGAHGMVATTLVVPPVRAYPLSNDAFVALRERFLSQSAAAMPAAVAAAEVDARERTFLSFTTDTDEEVEPETFRVAARGAASLRGSSGLVAPAHDVSLTHASDEPLFDRTPLSDGGQNSAERAHCQGRHFVSPPPAVETLDRAKPAVRRGRHANNGSRRVSKKV